MPIFTQSGYGSPLTTETSGYSSPFLNYSAPNPATSTGPYPTGAPLASSYQQQSFDIQNQDRTGQISDLVNTINRNAQTQANQARIPNNPALETQSSTNIGSELAGQVPQDVMNLLGQQAAERGVATGDVGGPNANAAYLRALGLTSLEQEQLGQQNLSAADTRNPGASIYDTGQQILTPYQGEQTGLTIGNQNIQAFQDLMQNQLAQQKLALQQAQLYSNPSLNYGGTTTGTSGLTGQDVFPSDITSTGSSPYYGSPSGNPGLLDNAFDTAPASPLDSTSDYATTPMSVYG